MIISALTIAAATASKWLITGKIMTILGTCCLTVAPEVKQQNNFRHRRTDQEIREDRSDTEKKAAAFQYVKNTPLSTAIDLAENTPGVYVLRLNGQVMKCGRASYNKGSSCGVAWRLRQYYNLNYDNQARMKNHWSVNEENRDQITVSWQCCPISKCQELERKLFEKYGKGPWTRRAPEAITDDTWELLI